METLVGTPVPEFTVQAVVKGGEFTEVSSDSLKGKWTVLLFYPLDFTFVCPTEIIAYDGAQAKLSALNAQVMGISVDSHFTHRVYVNTARGDGGIQGVTLPLLADPGGVVARQFGVLNEAGVSLRGLFLVDPEGVIQHATINNLPVGRNVDETLRIIEAFQFHAENGDVCPANWTKDAKSMSPTDEGLREYFKG
ncbi:MAG: peroxiredoxin [Deltaproteobacteria bacterium]|nr:peroxiredoxin [Deltaproteobacteria bacterium]MBW2419915.1 peroxiredoxin [Deltaproteobacteria bacterium]